MVVRAVGGMVKGEVSEEWGKGMCTTLRGGVGEEVGCAGGEVDVTDELPAGFAGLGTFGARGSVFSESLDAGSGGPSKSLSQSQAHPLPTSPFLPSPRSTLSHCTLFPFGLFSHSAFLFSRSMHSHSHPELVPGKSPGNHGTPCSNASCLFSRSPPKRGFPPEEMG